MDSNSMINCLLTIVHCVPKKNMWPHFRW